MPPKSFRHRFRERLNQIRSKSRDPPEDAHIDPNSRIRAELTLESNSLDSSSQHAISTSSSLVNRTRDTPAVPNTAATMPEDNTQARTSDSKKNPLPTHVSHRDELDVVVVPSDIWSTAYCEAVDRLGDDVDVDLLEGENVARLFKQLEAMGTDPTQESAFLKGVRYLRSLKIPLERFKLALDLATPLTNIEPTAATVCTVVKSVTGIAITIATADLDFAKQIGEMLEQISYIDDCDTLGQKSEKPDIHEALVLIYGKLLEFYFAAYEILTSKGAKLVKKLILETDRLPTIVQDFSKLSDNLRKLIQKETWEIVEEIRSMFYDQEIARWLGSGKLRQQSKHHADLQNLRADQACEPLLADINFLNWYQASDAQQLVILGNMGSGKSVAISFIIDELRRRNEHQLPQPKICYHYCRDDETGEAINVFSSMILSLLEQLSGLKKTFYERYRQAGASGNFEPATNVRKLEELFQDIVKTLDRPLFIVIDGLDECSGLSQNTLLRSLKALLEKTSRLKILLASRPQEEILDQLDGTMRLDICSDPDRDRLIVGATVERTLFHLSKDVRALVTETLSRLAQGSAIWTKMIVELIEIRRIRALGPMRVFLSELSLPEQLSELYCNLVSRCTSNDPENRKLAITALEILAVTRRPLSILELAWAVVLGTAQHGFTTVATIADAVDPQRIMSLIYPFVTHVEFSDSKKHQVRLVHQSVKEFVVGGLPPSLLGLGGQDMSTASNQEAIHLRSLSLEASILDICIKYLLLDDIGHGDLFTEEQLAIEELPQEYDLFDNDGDREVIDLDPLRCTWEEFEENMSRYDPTDRGFGELFVYASCHWLEHFSAVTAEPLPSRESIEKICQVGSTRMQNWIKQNCRPECTIQARFVFDSRFYDALVLTSLYGSKAMLRDMLENSDFDKKNFLPDSAMVAADQIFQWGDISRLSMLFSGRITGHQLKNLEFFRLGMIQWSVSDKQDEGWDLVFDLVHDVLDILVKEQWGNELLCIAASTGCIPMIERLINSAQRKVELRNELLRASLRKPRIMSPGKPDHQSIGEAVVGNHVDVVKYLLGQQGIEAHLQYRNSNRENVLHLASILCNPAMFRLLVPRFRVGVCQTDNWEDTALVRIISRSPGAPKDRYESAHIILSEGSAMGDNHSNHEQDPLLLAAKLDDLEMCRILVCVGKINPSSALSYDEYGQMVLKEETSENRQNRLAILQLLRSHVDVGLA